MNALDKIEAGFQVFLHEGEPDFGAVRAVMPEGRDEIVVYVENGGDFRVPAACIASVHDGKVLLDERRIDSRLRDAIAHAHDREEQGL